MGYRVVPYERSLAYHHPELVKEWNFEKNGDLKPEVIAVCSSLKVWWICEKKHEWKACIINRAYRGHNCPYCSGLLATKETCLATRAPDLADEWHPTKNGSLTPETVRAKSNKKVWWRCKKGHEWKAKVESRFNGANCPICFASNQTSFQSLALYYYFKKVNQNTRKEYRVNSSTVTRLDVYLPNLNLAIEYDGEYYHQDIRKDIKKDLKIMEHNLLKDATLIRIREPQCPRYHSPNPNVRFIYLKDKREETLETVIRCLLAEYFPEIDIDVNLNRDRAEIDSLIEHQKKKNSLQEQFPKIAAEWHPIKNGTLTPMDVLPRSNKRVWWRCRQCGHEWQTIIANRTKKKTGCPLCARKVTKERSLATLSPEIAAEWHPEKNGNLTPDQVAAQSSKKYWWRCKHGYEWQAVVSNRVNMGRIGHRKCPECRKERQIQKQSSP